MMTSPTRNKFSDIFQFVIWKQILFQVLFPLISMLPYAASAQTTSEANTSRSPFSTVLNDSKVRR